MSLERVILVSPQFEVARFVRFACLFSLGALVPKTHARVPVVLVVMPVLLVLVAFAGISFYCSLPGFVPAAFTNVFSVIFIHRLCAPGRLAACGNFVLLVLASPQFVVADFVRPARFLRLATLLRKTPVHVPVLRSLMHLLGTVLVLTPLVGVRITSVASMQIILVALRGALFWR
jgi:hypothetical protein